MRNRVWFCAVMLAMLLSGCARSLPQAAAAPAPPPSRSAVVIARRTLAARALRNEVLIILAGAPSADAANAPGVELIVQTSDGRTLSCIDTSPPPPRIGMTVLFGEGGACAPPDPRIAASGPIR